MATSLFSEVRNRQLSEQLAAALDDNYTARPIVRTGIVLSSNQVQVANQRYALSGGSSDLVIGSRLAVQNVGRAAAAIYTPTMSSGAPLMGSAGIAPSGYSIRPGGGTKGGGGATANEAFYNSQFASLYGIIGDLNGNYGYTTETYGTAFGDYATINITTDPTNGFRIRSYETPVFQADTTGVVWALSTFRAGTGDDMVGMSATDATWRLYAGNAIPANADFRVDKDGKLYATGATISGALTATTGAIGGWTVNATSIYTGTEDHSGYTANAGDITIYSDGSDSSIHAKNFYIDSGGNLTATSATITGTVNATAGYFGDGATRVTIEAAGINVGNTGSIRGGQTNYDTGTGFWLGYTGAYKFSIGAAAGRRMTWDGVNLTVNDALVTGIAAGSELTIQGWQCTCVFSATDADTVAWGAGVFTLADGTAYNIDAGNTGNMAARNYIYLNKAVSTTVLQKTTTASTAVGTGKVLIATAINSTTEALWQVFNGSGGVQIGGGQIEQRSITASEIATGTLTANEIAANTITASQIAANTITAGQIASATITTTQIAASTIVAANIATGTITADKLTVTAGGANLLLNSSFQVDTDADGVADNWSIYNNGPEAISANSVETSGGVDGRAFQRVTWTAPNTSTKGVYQLLPSVRSGRTYIVSFYAKGSISVPANLQLQGEWSNYTVLAQPNITTAWQRYVFRKTLASDAAELYITIQYVPSCTGTLDIDHVQVEEADTPSAWKPYPSELEPGSVTADKISVTSLAAIQVDTGALNLSGFLTIGAAGGIYQGSGTAGTPTTGLKIWHDTGVGRIAGYNATVLQWSADTDGKLKAGAGAVVLDEDGITLASATSGGDGSLKTKSSTVLIGEYYTGKDGANDVYGGVDLYNYDATSNVTSSFGVYHSAGLSSRYVSASTPTTSVNTIVGSKLVLNIRAATGTVVSLQDNFTTEYWALTNAGTIIGPAWKPAANSTTALQMQQADGTVVLNVDTTNKHVGIGLTEPSAKLEIVGPNTSYPLLRMGNGAPNYYEFVRDAATGNLSLQGTQVGYNNIVLAPTSGNVGIGVTAPAAKFHTLLTDAGTDAVVNVAAIGHDTSGTAAAGFGGGLALQAETSTTPSQDVAQIAWDWNEATHATRKGELILTVFDTAAREGLRLKASGSAPTIGFLGASPQARQAHIADATDAATVITRVNAVIAALEAFGLLASS